MRTTATCTMRASSTDDTGNRTDGTHRAGITWRAIPRTIPRTHHSERYVASPCAGRAPPSGAVTTAARPAACALRTGPSATSWPARASARTTVAHADGRALLARILCTCLHVADIDGVVIHLYVVPAGRVSRRLGSCQASRPRVMRRAQKIRSGAVGMPGLLIEAR